MSVLGFDIGQQSCYIAVARQGGIETLANEYSDRNTPAFISFCEKNRLQGAAAKQQVISNVKNTVWGWKRLLGRKFNDPVVQKERKHLPYELVEMADGEVGIKVRYMNEPTVFTPQQVTAMLLSKLKDISEVNLKTKIVDIVLSVPCYYTDVERRALLDSTKLAGLNCLRLMNDTTAIALAYGIYKQDLPAPEEKPRNVIFLDLGHSDLQVSACAFNKGKLKVLATAANPSLGGRDFDYLLAEHFTKIFLEKYKVDAHKNPKAYLRLVQECEKMKKLMSANATPIPVNIECFMEDKDVTGKLQRADLEEMATGIMGEIKKVFLEILAASSLKPDEIYSVEIVGGCTRIPAIKDLVREVFNIEPSTTLNADEAVARGCALQCAILSPTFRVRDFSITDCQPYPITLSWNALINNEEQDMEVYNQFHQVPFSKMLTFYRTGPFKLEARYTKGSNIPFPQQSIGNFGIENVVPQATGDSSKVKVKVRVNIHGIFGIAGATMIEKIEVPAEEVKEDPKTESMDVENGTKAAGDAQTNGEPEPADAAKPEGEPMETEENKENTEQKPAENTAEAETKTEEGEKEKKDSPKKKNKVKTIDLPVTESVFALSQKDVSSLFEKECQMISQDRLEKERNDAKNTVEEYVYEMRDKLCTTLEEYVEEEARSKFTLTLEDVENWLYEDGEDEVKSVYVDKLTSLTSVGNPIVNRFREAETRPRAFQELGMSLQMIFKALEANKNKDEKYEHIPTAEMEKVEKCYNEKHELFNSYMNLCQILLKHQDPPITTTNIIEHKNSLEKTCHPILNTPKPKPKVEEPPKDEPMPEAKTDEQSESKPETEEQKSEQTPTPEQNSTSNPDMDLD